MVNIKPTIVAALKADAALVALLGGQRVYDRKAPNADQYPRITYYVLADVDSGHTHDQGPTLETKSISVDVWAKASTSAIEARVDAVMKGLGYRVTRENKIDLYEDDTEVYHAHMTYRFEMISQ